MRKIVDDKGNGIGWGYIPGRISPAIFTTENDTDITPIAYFKGPGSLLEFDDKMKNAVIIEDERGGSIMAGGNKRRDTLTDEDYLFYLERHRNGESMETLERASGVNRKWLATRFRQLTPKYDEMIQKRGFRTKQYTLMLDGLKGKINSYLERRKWETDAEFVQFCYDIAKLGADVQMESIHNTEVAIRNGWGDHVFR